ncbi:MAG: helix-turn-helix transcriptional regulator [Protaetiibacter sp.]
MTDTAADSIGSRIATARRAKGMTQRSLAVKVGVSFQAVSKWETEQTLPDVALLTRIADVLDMTLDELVAGRASAPPDRGDAAETQPRAYWKQILGVVTEDIHGDVGSVLGQVHADIYGDVLGDVVGYVRNIHGNVEGNVLGVVQGDIDGYVAGRLLGVIEGRVKLGVRGSMRTRRERA